MSSKSYIVATIKDWNKEMFQNKISKYPGNWHLIESPDELDVEFVRTIGPRYIFFPHWSYKVPTEILSLAECVCFHETDLPYGRGGSPIQNLIVEGHKSTKITALQMSEGFDAGPVYLKRDLSLDGLAEEIYLRAADLVADMIKDIVEGELQTSPQKGEVTVFKRRTPDQSEIEIAITSLEELFDHIRMLDANSYPRAFLTYGNYRFEFSRPALRTGGIEADVRITLAKGNICD